MNINNDVITLKEISEQPSAIMEALTDIKGKKKQILDLFSETLDEIVFTGCGTSYYLALSAASIFNKNTNRRAIALPSSEVFLFPTQSYERTLVIPISRSGETSETLLAAEYARKQKAKILAITCNVDSGLAKLADLSLISPSGKEKSVVMTKSFSSMLVISQALSAIVPNDKLFLRQLEKIPLIVEKIIKKHNKMAEKVSSETSLSKFVFLGQGPFYGAACEAMLKMKEMAITWSEAYHSLEFRHGPKSIVDQHTLVSMLLSDSARKYEVELIKEIQSYGAKLLTIHEKEVDEADFTVSVNSGIDEYARVTTYMPFLQLMGCYKALDKGLNPDSPSKLSQVVKL